MATESQNLPFACLTRLCFLLSAIVALHLSRTLDKSTSFYSNQSQFAEHYKKSQPFMGKRFMQMRHLLNAEKTNPISERSQ